MNRSEHSEFADYEGAEVGAGLAIAREFGVAHGGPEEGQVKYATARSAHGSSS